MIWAYSRKQTAQLILQTKNTLMADLSGWEEKEETIDFKLVRKARPPGFYSMTSHRTNNQIKR